MKNLHFGRFAPKVEVLNLELKSNYEHTKSMVGLDKR